MYDLYYTLVTLTTGYNIVLHIFDLLYIMYTV